MVVVSSGVPWSSTQAEVQTVHTLGQQDVSVSEMVDGATELSRLGFLPATQRGWKGFHRV